LTQLTVDDAGKMFVYPTTFHPAGGLNAASVVTLKSGEIRTGVDIALKPVPAVRISGTVMGPTGPAANLAVKITPVGQERLSSTRVGNDIAQTLTRPDGSFTVIGVPAGSYIVSVLRAGVQLGGESTRRMLWGRTPVSVGSADIDGVAIQLSTGFTIAGRTEFEPGILPPPPPDVVQRGRIVIRSLDDTTVAPAQSMTLGPDGSFKSAEFAPGEYTATATLAAPGWTLRSLVIGGRRVGSTFELSSDERAAVLTYTDKAAEITGTVTGITPDAQIVVALVPVDTRSQALSPQDRRFVAVRNGAFRFSDVLPGDYAAVAAAGTITQFDGIDEKTLMALARQGTRVTVGDREKKSLALTSIAKR
jgi:hypothetical protein